MNESDRIPLMFQAQLPARGKIQYAGNPKPAAKWVKQWLEGCPPIAEDTGKDVPAWKRRAINPKIKLPQFGKKVQTMEYTLTWRMVTSGGQDDGIIRPVIGAKGLPYYPGASMKGAFRRVCPLELLEKYCGSKDKPGILRFHGGYPVDMSWGDKKRLMDLVHAQEKKQIITNDVTTNANVQISLYKTTFKFGISASNYLTPEDWQEIQTIWEKALSQGIGSRVSAGYGYVKKVENGQEITIKNRDNILLSVNLRGQGLASLLLTPDKTEKIPEFRPNIFKAALRGHTLRLLAGVTDENTAQKITKQLWGGFEGKNAIVGKLGINFTPRELSFGEHRFGKDYMPTYDLKAGELDIITCACETEEEKEKLTKLAKQLIRFTLLLGGFGKSWRRVDHRKFYNQYFQHNSKAMIGCHWEFTKESVDLYILTNSPDLQNISKFLINTQKKIIEWLEYNQIKPSHPIKTWREVWHPSKVQVFAKIVKQSEAVHWFHGEYLKNKSIKQTNLTGKISQVGRIWHRMYPRYVINKDRNIIHIGGYIELLTIFPDDSPTTQDFLTFLNTDSSGFIKVFG
ncbi:MAG: hypothetical protein KME64_15965 [Scytonematopsis contorta HA4267-MV1]|jgi:CRISPR-associated protein Cmr6|nr:hypothetical protein [Scytonematopsis contorta HA4267-MV1]